MKDKPDLRIDAYRMSDGGLFLTYEGTPPPEMIAIALEVAEQIQQDFGEATEPVEDPFM